MRISISKRDEFALVELDGNIRSLKNTQSVMHIILDIIETNKNIEVNIKNSYTVSSVFIGFLIQQIQANHIHLKLNVYDEKLYSLFDILELVDKLDVKLAG
jgi:hypothetical protein